MAAALLTHEMLHRRLCQRTAGAGLRAITQRAAAPGIRFHGAILRILLCIILISAQVCQVPLNTMRGVYMLAL